MTKKERGEEKDNRRGDEGIEKSWKGERMQCESSKTNGKETGVSKREREKKGKRKEQGMSQEQDKKRVGKKNESKEKREQLNYIKQAIQKQQ